MPGLNAAAAPAPSAPVAASGLQDNVAGMLAYITIVPAIIFLVMAPYNQNKFIRFHAFQSIFLNVGMIAYFIASGILAAMLHWFGLLIAMLMALRSRAKMARVPLPSWRSRSTSTRLCPARSRALSTPVQAMALRASLAEQIGDHATAGVAPLRQNTIPARATCAPFGLIQAVSVTVFVLGFSAGRLTHELAELCVNSAA